METQNRDLEEEVGRLEGQVVELQAQLQQQVEGEVQRRQVRIDARRRSIQSKRGRK